MLEIILDASQITAFERCPQLWYLDHIRNLTSTRTNPNLSTGSYFHEVLRTYYELGITNPPVSNNIAAAVDRAVFLATDIESAKRWPAVKAEPKFYIDRLRSYFVNHMTEDDNTEIIAVEKGFSWLLYEDSERRYILEGMIDLISVKPVMGLTVTDHKTQSRSDDIYEFNHQVMNYLAFTGANYFEYNYIGLQDAQNKNTFRRPIYKPQPGQIEQWKKDVRTTFREMEQFLALEKQGEAFPRRRASCSGKYGLCQFHKRCEIPDDSPYVQLVENGAYKEKEERWRAWR